MKTIKFTISALCLFLVSLTYGQQSYYCSVFEPGSASVWQNWNTTLSIQTPSSDQSHYLEINDDGGSSWGYNSTNFPTNWQQFTDEDMNVCLCFDFKVIDDGLGNSTSNVHPKILIYEGVSPQLSSIRATFVATITVTENDEWVRVCAPIKYSDGTSLPSNADGTWTGVGITPVIWNSLLSGVGGVAFDPDIAAPQDHDEIIGVDNICIEDCGALIDSNPFGAYCCGTGDDNLVINGNFEDAINLDFTSDYTNNPSVYPGNFSVAASAAPFNAVITDHSNCPSSTQYPLNDQFLLVNGRTQQPGNPTAVIWEHVLTGLDTSSTYKFCANFISMPQCTFDIPPKVSFEVDGIGIGGVTTLSAPSTACDWVNKEINFNTTLNTSVTLQIILDQTGNGDGNDLAIDDISASKLFDPELSITVQHQGNPQLITASLNSIDQSDDQLHVADCVYNWFYAEVLTYPLITTTPPMSYPGGLTITFPSYLFAPDVMYMIGLYTDVCGCYDEGFTYQLTLHHRGISEEVLSEDHKQWIIDQLISGNNEVLNLPDQQNDGSNNLTIYPNPVENSFTISLKGGSLKSVEIMSITGQTIISKNYTDGNTEEILDISQLASGIYLVKAYGADNTQYTTKVVKE